MHCQGGGVECLFFVRETAPMTMSLKSFEGTLAHWARAGQSFNGHRPIFNRLGACVCMGFSDAQHNGIWALLAQESEQRFQERRILSIYPLTKLVGKLGNRCGRHAIARS